MSAVGDSEQEQPQVRAMRRAPDVLAEAAERYAGQNVSVSLETSSAYRSLPPTYTGDVFVTVVEDETLVPIGDGLALPARFVIDKGRFALVVTCKDGVLVRDEIRERLPGRQTVRRGGLADHVVEQAAASLVRTLQERELPRAAWATTDEFRERERQINEGYRGAGLELRLNAPIPVGERVRHPMVLPPVRRAYRARVTLDDLRRVAELYAKEGIDAVKVDLSVGERQAWKYVARARSEGFLAEPPEPPADDLPTRAAEAYWAGGIGAVREALNVKERQAWRYVRRAQEAGLLPRLRRRKEAP